MSTVNRRRFLQQSTGAAGVAAGFAILPSRKALGATANDTIGAAVIGFNSRGQGHIDEILAKDDKGVRLMKGVELRALCDVDQRVLDRGVDRVGKAQGTKPKPYTDLRKLFEDKDVDVIFTATPNFWHALATIWGCQAGKDVYCEKPACWSFMEGEAMIAAAKKYRRVVQIGHNVQRANGGTRGAVARAWAGQIGEVYLSRGLCYKPRTSIGVKPDSDPPAWLTWELWQGPTRRRPFNANYVHYNWHWFFDYGNGDLGNQGVHQMDEALWFLNRPLPVFIHSAGGRYGYVDQGQTPNTQFCSMRYDDGKVLEFEVRGLPTNSESGAKIGNLVYGSKGWMSSGDRYRAIGGDGQELPKPEGALPPVGGAGGNHFRNFIDVVRSRKLDDLNCPVEVGVRSAQACILPMISYRVGRSLVFDPVNKTFPGADDANALLQRHDSPPDFTVPAPDKV